MAGRRSTVASGDSVNFPDDMDTARFLDRHWQREPLFLRDAVDVTGLGIDAEALFEIAMEPEAQSRLVTRRGDRWRVEHGPLEASQLEALPTRNWTLLVQAMEVWEPALHDLIARFSFLPRWRTDDVMISLAAPGGGVGPHVDQYDVFLIQGAGRRRWAWAVRSIRSGPVSRCGF